MRWGFIRSSAVLACVLAAGHSLLAQSLLSVPDNAIAMIKVNNLEQTSRKAGSLLKQWGLVALNPMLADPLTSLQTMTNLSQGVNRAGEAAMIFINPQAGNQPRQPAEGEPYIILVPVSDYDAFLKNFPDAATEEDMTSATLPLAQQNCFITKWDNYAAISPQRALLATRPKSTNASGLAAKELAGKDIIAYINFPGFKAQAQQGLGFVRMLAIGSLDQSVGQDPEKAKLLPVAKAAMAQLFNGLDHFINETKAMTVGLQLSDNGVQTTFVSEFDPKSYLGQIASSWKNSNANFLTGLPDGNYAMIGSVALDGATFVKLVDDATGPVVPELVKAGDAGKSLLDCIAGVKLLWTSCKSEAFGLTASSGKAG